MVAILGAGPHGRELAHLLNTDRLYDDLLDGYEPCSYGAQNHKWIAGPMWPAIRAALVSSLVDPVEPWHDGRYVFPGARVSHDTIIGPHTHIGYNAVISHGCQLGEFVTVCSGAVLSGEVQVGDGVFIGANAAIIHGGIRIGHGAAIAAGAVVTHDVFPRTAVGGVPARCLS